MFKNRMDSKQVHTMKIIKVYATHWTYEAFQHQYNGL
jgi:hypothetical protein